MSLIRCPECSRENVSDEATACPGCGYPIKQWLKEIQQNKVEETENKTVVDYRENVGSFRQSRKSDLIITLIVISIIIILFVL